MVFLSNTISLIKLFHGARRNSTRGDMKKGVCKLFMEIHLTATECHLPYGITQCYLPPDTSENVG